MLRRLISSLIFTYPTQILVCPHTIKHLYHTYGVPMLNQDTVYPRTILFLPNAGYTTRHRDRHTRDTPIHGSNSTFVLLQDTINANSPLPSQRHHLHPSLPQPKRDTTATDKFKLPFALRPKGRDHAISPLPSRRKPPCRRTYVSPPVPCRRKRPFYHIPTSREMLRFAQSYQGVPLTLCTRSLQLLSRNNTNQHTPTIPNALPMANKSPLESTALSPSHVPAARILIAPSHSPILHPHLPNAPVHLRTPIAF